MNNLFTALSIGSLIVPVVLATPIQAQPIALTQLFPALTGIELIPPQQSKLAQLSRQTLDRIKLQLSPAQSQKFDAALAQGKSVRNTLPTLNLAMSQQLKLNRELQSMRSNLSVILTPKQQQQLAQNIRTLK
jgi:hypothetical protein